MATAVTNLTSNTDWGTITTNAGNNNTAYTITTSSGRDFRVGDLVTNAQVEYLWVFPETVYVTQIDVSFNGTTSSVSNSIIMYNNQTQVNSLPAYLTSIKVRQSASYATPNMPFIVKGLSITYDTEPTPPQPSNSVKYNLINPNNGNSCKLIVGNSPISFAGSDNVNRYLGTFKDENNRPIPYYQISSTYDSNEGLYDVLLGQCKYPYTTPEFLGFYNYYMDVDTCNCFNNFIFTLRTNSYDDYEGSIQSNIYTSEAYISGNIHVENIVSGNDKLLVLGRSEMDIYNYNFERTHYAQIPIYGDYCTYCGKFLCVSSDRSELLSSTNGVNWNSELTISSEDACTYGYVNNQIFGHKIIDGQNYLYNYTTNEIVLLLSNNIAKFKQLGGIKYFWTLYELYAYLNDNWVLCYDKGSYDAYNTITKIDDKYYMFDYNSKKLLVSSDFKIWEFQKYTLRGDNNNV